MGTEDKPKHSCDKCIENDIFSQEERENGAAITKITYQENGTSFCDISKNYKSIIDYCSEATWLIDEDGERHFNCTKCEKDSEFIYKADKDMHLCVHFNYSKHCMVKNCKTYKNGNNYFCSQCLLENYEVNPATGSCVKTLPKHPAISWKDMFRLTLNSNTRLNCQDLYGFSVYLRGISYNQITPGHAFLIDLTFDILYNRNLRNIEENETESETEDISESREWKIPTYCQIIHHTDEVKDKVNLIDYYCFGNRTGEDDIRENEINLKKIEMSNDDNEENKEFLLNSNFEEMISELNLTDLKNKDVSSFTLKMFDDITVFEMDKVVNQKSDNYKFDFTISGKINRELEPDTIKTKFKFIGLENKTADCEFIIKKNQTADLKCYVDLKNYKDKEPFKFKTIEFKYKESSIFLNRLNEINLVHEEKKPDYSKIILIGAACIIIIIFIISIVLLKKIFCKKKKKAKEANNFEDYRIYDKYINYINSSDRINPKKTKKSLKNVHNKPKSRMKKNNKKNADDYSEKSIGSNQKTNKNKNESESGENPAFNKIAIKKFKQEADIYSIKNQ